MPTELSLEYLFVYGTLMRGHTNPYSTFLAEHASFFGEGYAPGDLYLIDWYPGAVYNPDGHSHFWGEIYQLRQPHETLKILDVYEEVSENQGEYIRRSIEVQTQSGLRLSCWTYLYNWPLKGFKRIANGRF
ncbi:gamma-glutamylcyclotransferase family protein [Dyadobacter tibetensis]|uniref:gamma-glutamylcyclotransferase family protein n=1 Tax=Dyadobacter tibetensis TaxID=1211851 RepID=UPI00047252B6|nr:gamma-glutamylcyclotransferase family protein [Dyadobacter tibetensis]